jgi:valyl-tRNA synthetase
VTGERLPARYSPHEVEARLMREWLAEGAFHAQVDSSRTPYSIVIPPPNVTGSLHMGHALNSTIQDILIRYHRARSRNAMWLVGTDHAGIATQAKVEAQLAAEGVRKDALGREAFLERVWQWREEYGSTIIHQLKRLGCACDYERERFTMDQPYQHAVLDVFVDLHQKGDIYRDVYLVNWCTRCGSAISDLEVEHVERTDRLYYLRYPVVGTSDFLTVATTRPETMLGDTAVAVNPQDPRYGRYVGGTAIVPLAEREVPIIADEHVDPEFGTGALKITPGHDPNDWEIAQRHGLPAMSVIGFDGRMNEEAGRFAGLEAREARDRVIGALEERALFVKAEDYTHSVGTCYRCGTVIEPLLSLQWFMNMQRLAAPAIEVVEQGRVRFVPERWGDVYLEWMRSIRPWCISRQLWWGHRLPVWYCEACEKVIVSREPPDQCPDCGGGLHQDEDVLDTWFSSALWPFATLGWPEETPELGYFYPTAVLSTARDIIYLWVARMIMMGLEYRDEVPFHDVIIHPTILASDGRRMSKSLGTGVDPLDLITEYGADATRFGLAYMSSVQDVRFSAERIEMGRNFANKIWNASRLVIQGAPEGTRPTVDRATPADRWIFSRLLAVTGEIESLYEAYDFAEVTRVLYRFIWNEICDWYLEIAKARLYHEDPALRLQVAGNLVVLLERVLGLLHPVMPFVTEEIYRQLPQVQAGESPAELFGSPLAEPEQSWADPAAEKTLETFVTVTAGLRSAREDLGVPRDAVGRVHLVAEDETLLGGLLAHAESLRQLSGCEIISADGAPESGEGRFATIPATPGLRVLLALEGMVDVEKERTRLLNKARKAQAEADKARKKLDNEGFVRNAPPEVVEEERSRLAQAEGLLDELRRQYSERIGEELPR